jgi:enamine deaminase RidA (YjgF/YER057c/UK114 family)
MKGDAERSRSIQPPGWKQPRGYANGILVPPNSCLLAVAGQIAWDEQHRLVGDDFAEQFAQSLRNVVGVVREAGGQPGHVIRLTFYVVDREAYRLQMRRVGELYREIMGDHYPACTLVEVRALLEPGAMVEIEATAALPADLWKDASA